MLYVDIPTLAEFRALTSIRADACVSIYLPATPHTQHADATRIELGNLVRQALQQLEAAGLDNRRHAAIAEQLADLGEDDAFWRLQAHSLAVLCTPDSTKTFRLPNQLQPLVEVSDRFHLKPLLRAITFPNHAFVLAVAESGVRLVEVSADLPAVEIPIADMPKDAGSATGRASVNDRSPSGRIQGAEGQKVLLRQYARSIDAALRPFLAGRSTPLILAATEPLRAIYRTVASYPGLATDSIAVGPDTTSPAQLAAAARSILDGIYAQEIQAFAALFQARSGQGRATSDVAQAARAATFGGVDTLLVDIDEVILGTIDEETGAVSFATQEGAGSYGVVDEIASRALGTGARVLGVRQADIPGGKSLAAVLRYPM